MTAHIPETMKAVVFHGPQKIAVEDRPVPKIQDATDAIVKVILTALCGRYVSICNPMIQELT